MQMVQPSTRDIDETPDLDANTLRHQAELALAANRLALLENYATLCQSPGGGTEAMKPCPIEPDSFSSPFSVPYNRRLADVRTWTSRGRASLGFLRRIF